MKAPVLDATSQLAQALEDLKARQRTYALYRDYYEGNHRLLFATDMTMEGNVARVRDADISDEQRERIFCRNFEAMLARRRC